MYGKEYIDWKESVPSLLDKLRETQAFYTRMRNHPTNTNLETEWFKGVLTGLHITIGLVESYENKLPTPKQDCRFIKTTLVDSF